MTKTQPTNEAFTHFREMTRKFVNPPKAVVDARAKAEKAEPKPDRSNSAHELNPCARR
jgi:hypothetical protein